MKRFARPAFQRERAASAFDHVDDELGVFPGFILGFADVERAAADVA
jgi:hypothetical protein